MNRRHFLATSAVSTAGLATSAAFAQDKPVAANDKVTVALIGCGGMGNANLADFVRLKEFEIVALCDVDERQFARSLQIVEKAGRPTSNVKKYEDYRKMLDERKDIDCVIIGTPDHHHAYALIHACNSGKNGQGCDVYCEKPISHNIVEGRAMVNAVRQQKRVCQIGTQQRSGKHFQDVIQFVHSGKLGRIHLARTWITNNTAPNGHGNPPDQNDAPKGVNYDLWLGPAPKKPFNQARFHGNFRWFQDYGNGLCNDWGVHLNDFILWGMKVHAPLSVFACGGKHDMKDNSDTPDTLDVHYEYPTFTHIYTVRRGKSHGGFGGRGHGMEFVGSEGTLTFDRGGWVLTRPDGSQEKHGGFDDHFAHVKNFLHCLRHRDEKPASEIEDMHRATSTCHLANISYKVGRRIYWNGEEEKCYRGIDLKQNKCVLPDTDANALLMREPREGWKLTVS
jgi:predicted dehydrogenase